MSLSRRWVAIAAVAVGTGAAVLLGVPLARVVFGPRATGVSPGEVGKRALPAVVQLQEALHSHPRWGELALLTLEVSRSVEADESYRDAVADATSVDRDVARKVTGTAGEQLATISETQRQEAEKIQATYQRRLSEREKEVWTAVEAKVAARQATLSAQLDQDIGVKRGEMKESLAAEVEEIQRQYQARILSYQLQLSTMSNGPSSADEMERVKVGLAETKAELAQKVEAKEREYGDRLSAYVKEESTRAQAELKSYGGGLLAEAERTLAGVRERLEGEMRQELAARTKAMAVAKDRAGVYGQAPPSGGIRTVSDLQRRRNDLQDLIVADVRRVAEAVAKKRGLAPLIVGYRVETPGVDITGDVQEILRRGE